MGRTGALNFYARDVYPDTGSLETSILSVPDADNQRTLEVDDEAVKQAEKVQNGGNKKGVFTTIAVIIGVVVIMAAFRS